MVDGSSSIARKYGISSFVVGLTVVAFGTSAPELVISVAAGIKGSVGIALGNIIGSNISNTLLILGVAAIITPLAVKKATVNKEIPFSLLAILAVAIMANDLLIDGGKMNGLTRIDGMVLILFFIIFIYYTFGISREKEGILQKTVNDIKDEKSKKYSNIVAIAMIIFGLAGLSLGGHWIVSSAIVFASLWGVSEALIGLTIVAIGTSLPELAASAMAARKGQTDIAIGNVVGSNIFNLLWVLGAAATIKTIGYDSILNIDMLILAIITLVLLFLIYIGKKNIIGRWEGGVLLSMYIAYLVFLIYRG